MDRRNFIMALALSMAILPCAHTFGASTKKVSASTVAAAPLATVDGTPITLEEFNARIKVIPAQYAANFQTKEGKTQLLEQMINEQVLLNTARQSGIEKSAEFKTQMDLAKDQILIGLYIRNNIPQTATVTDEEALEFFKANPAQFRTDERRSVQQVLVATEAEAKSIAASVVAGTSMDSIAKAKSLDPGSSANGGYIGWITKGQTVPEFEQATFSHKPGDAPVVAKSQFGYHVIKVLEIQPGSSVDFAQAKTAIQNAISTQKRQAILANNVNEARKKSKVTSDPSKL